MSSKLNIPEPVTPEQLQQLKEPHPYGPPCPRCAGRVMQRYTGQQDEKGLPVIAYECGKCGPMEMDNARGHFRYVPRQTRFDF